MTFATSCRITYKTSSIYIVWLIEFFATVTLIRLIHEFLHGFYAILTGGVMGQISVMQWILFYPVLQIDISGGNPFVTLEGTLITTWLISLLIMIMTSYPFLKSVMPWCNATNLTGYLYGVRLGAIFEMFGTSIYAMPNFMFYIGNYRFVTGDGTEMALIFEQMYGIPQLQYVIAFIMLIGSFFALWWAISCDPEICSCKVG